MKLKQAFWVILLIFLGLFFRRHDGFLHAQIYAEDGPIFLAQYMEKGWASLITPYAGYLHTIPRLIALLWGTLGVDLEVLPTFYNLSYFGLCVLIGLELLKSARQLEMKHKILFASIFPFVPVGPEMFMNITNSIWVTSLYLVNFLFVGYKYYEAENRKWLKLICIMLVSLTGPFSLLLSPVAALIIFLERKTMTMKRLVPMGLIMVCGLVQFMLIRSSPHNRAIPGDPEPHHLVRLIKYNMADLIYSRNNLLPSIGEKELSILLLSLFAFIVYMLFRHYRRITADRKYVLVLAPIMFLASFIAVFWPMETKVLAFGCPRYYFVPYTCAAWIFILGADSIMRIKDIVVYFIYFLFHANSMRFNYEDKKWKEQMREYKAGKREEIDIHPEGWKFRLPPYKGR
ncbi:hypothetical protein GCM10023093_13450 [Nemorincola caseinilytica]|uniref:Glycosyltransferase RgtA/B/C/D-like domain-containing protein n=1 Tax=Nemorincola caseinilytica TaxID=2054315 RepID=A0ABP8NAL2_9BACT